MKQQREQIEQDCCFMDNRMRPIIKSMDGLGLREYRRLGRLLDKINDALETRWR